MRIGTWIVIGRAADATWIQNHGAVRQLDQVLLVAVAAQNHTSLNVAQPFPDRGRMCSHQPMFRNLLHEILIVAGRCAVAGEDAMICMCEDWHGSKPSAVALVELRVGVAIRCTHPCGIGS